MAFVSAKMPYVGLSELNDSVAWADRAEFLSPLLFRQVTPEVGRSFQYFESVYAS